MQHTQGAFYQAEPNFQYKLLNNILYLNRDLHRFKIINDPSCSFCHHYPETVSHFFVECLASKNLYLEIKTFYEKSEINLPEFNSVNILLGVDEQSTNYIVLSYKIFLYKSRACQKYPTFQSFKNFVAQNEKIEYNVALSRQMIKKHIKKWKKLISILDDFSWQNERSRMIST